MLMIGSSVAFYHQYPSKARTGRKPLGLSQQTREELTLTIAMLIIKRFSKNQPPWTLDELQAYTRLSAPMIEAALALLVNINFIRTTDEQPCSYLPVNAVESVRINDIRHRLREYAPDGRDIRHRCQEQQSMHTYLTQFHQASDDEFGQMTFAELLNETPNTAEGKAIKENVEIDLNKDTA
jgi:membrane protein